MLDFLGRWKTWAFWAVLGCGAALVFTTLVGGLLFNLESSTVFSWFCTVLLVIFAVMLAVALLLFILWYLFSRPMVIIPIIAGIALLLGAVFAFIKPEATPFLDLGEILEPMLGFLK